MNRFTSVKNRSKLKNLRNIVLIVTAIFIFNLSALQVSAESIFNLMGLVSYSDGNSSQNGDQSSPNSFANARAYRSNIDTNFKNSNKPSDRRIYEAENGDPAYFLFDVGSSAWNPGITSNDTSIVVLETYQGQNGWSGPSYVAGVKSGISQNHLYANGLDYGDASVTNPIQNAVMEQIPTPTLKSETTTSLTIGWKGLWDNSTAAQGGTPHNSIVGYSVFRSDNQAAFEFIGSVAQNPGADLIFEDTTAILGHNYIYKIRVQFEWNAHNPAYYETVAESAQSETFSVSIPLPDRLAFTTSEQSIVAGTNSSVITIQTRDEDGNDTPVQSDTTIDLTSSSNGVNKRFYFAQNNLCTTTVITSIQILTGSSSAQICYYDEKSSDTTWTLTASKLLPADGEWQNATQSITINNASLAAFDLNLSTPQNNKAAFTGLNELTALDVFGNVVKNFDVSTNVVTFTFNPIDGVLSGLRGASNNQLTEQSDFINGVANLSDLLTFSGSSGFHTFTATSANNVVATSSPVFINPAVATRLQVIAPATVTAGTQFNITSIIALDEFDNVDTNFEGSKLVSYSGPSNSPLGTSPVYTTSVNFVNGVSVSTLATILVNAETTSINVMVDNLSGVSNSIDVSAASASNLQIVAPNSAVAGENFNITSITAFDQYGNIDNNYTGQKTLIYSGPSNGPVSGAPSYTTNVNFEEGVSTTQLVTQLVNKENVRINVTDASISGESGNINVLAGSVGSIESVSGNNQTAQINTFLANPLVVKVTDLFGNSKNNYPVSFTITKGNGYLAIETPITNADGLASQNFRLGTVAATNSDQVQVEIFGANGSPIVFDATATPNAAANLLVSAPENVTAGTSFSINLTVVDDQGNVITTYTGVKTVSYSGANNSPSATAPTYLTSVEFINGLAVNVPTTLVNVESTILNLNISEDNLSGTSNAINVVAAITSGFIIEAPATVQSGVAFNLILLRTVDAYGNETVDYNGTKTLEYSGAAIDPVSGNSPIYTEEVDFENGVATTILATTLYKAESINLLVKEGLIEGTSNPISVTYNEDYIIYYVSGNNQTGVAGRALDDELRVIVLDNQGNPALDKVVTFTVTNGGGSVSEPNTVDLITGEVSVVWTLGTTVGSQSISASVDGIETVINFIATAVSDSASIITINPLSISTYAGYSTEEINLCLQDQFGNQVVTNINRTISLGSSSGTGEFSTESSGPWGIDTTDIIVGQSCVSVFYKDSTSGTFTFTASSNAITPGLMTINVLALVPTTLLVSPSSFTINSTATQQLSAVVYDQFNQSMANVTLVWEINDANSGTITQNGQYYPSNIAGTYTNGIRVSYSGLTAFSTPTVIVTPTPQPDEPEQPVPTPVVPVQPVLTPITPSQPDPIPTEEVTIIVDQDYFSDEEGEIPIKVEVPAITILSPKHGSLILSNGNVSISGMSTPDQLILIKDSEGNTLTSVTSDKNGYWKTYVGRNKFYSDQGTVTATVFKSNVSTLPLTFDFKPRSIIEYLMGFILQ